MPHFMLKPKGRTELLEWLNSFLDTNYLKVEDLKDGIAYTQLFDAVFQSKLPLYKIDVKPQAEDAYLKNLMFLEDLFTKKKIPYHINVERVSKGKFPDNMEFLQWCYTYISRFYPTADANYEPKARRREAYEKRREKERKQRNSSAIRRRQMKKRRAIVAQEHSQKKKRRSPAPHPRRHPSDTNVDQLLSEYPFASREPEEYIPHRHGLQKQTDPYDEHEQMIDFVLNRRKKSKSPHSKSPMRPSLPKSLEKMLEEEELLDDEEEKQIKRTLIKELSNKHLDDFQDIEDKMMNDVMKSIVDSPESPQSYQNDDLPQHVVKQEDAHYDPNDPLAKALQELNIALETHLSARMRKNRKKHNRLSKLAADRDFYADKLDDIEKVCAMSNVPYLEPIKQVIDYQEPRVFLRKNKRRIRH
mmetsp:Transcript_7642/g.11348  ORF Transcript_7642/g.11348 Transcript_7642/m.11348 type:complete len:415 (+) Transcript_7642:76-1320(+)